MTTARDSPVIQAGAVVRLGRAASVQFALQPLVLRVIRVLDWPTYDGWVWLDGYELGRSGEAVERRSVFVRFEKGSIFGRH